MSFQSTGWVIDHSPTTGTDRLVLLALANYGAEHLVDRGGRLCWEAWPSVERIAFEAGLSKIESARKSLRRMTEEGHIEVVENGCPDERIPARQRPNLYRILTDSPRQCWRGRTGKGCTTCDAPPPRGGAQHGTDPSDPPPGGTMTPLPAGLVTPHGEGAKQVDEQVTQQPTKRGPEKESGPPLKERNRAALAKLPKAVNPEDVQRLCILLRDRMYRHQGGDGPATITPNWVSEMGRLLNSGPKGVDGYVPTAEQVAERIDAIFDLLAETEGSSTFCWATVIQSPGNLRDKWARISVDLNARRAKGGTRPAAEVADAVGKLRGMLDG